MPKNRRTEGSITELAKNHFVVRIYLGEIDGKREYPSRTVHGPRKEAERVKRQLLAERDAGNLTSMSCRTVAEFVATWLQDIAAQRVRPRTYDSYEQVMRLYILPDLGEMLLGDISSPILQKLLNGLTRRGLSPRTVRYAHAVLRSALTHAYDLELISRNFAKGLTLPRQERKEQRVLNAEEADRFLSAMRGTRWGVLFSLLLWSAMRPGEALGLKWGDLNPESKRVHIQRTLVYSRKTGDWSLQPPKTKGSRRPIPLPAAVLEELQEHRLLEIDNGRGGNDDLIFVDSTGEPPDYTNLVRRYFNPVLKEAGLPDISPYSLRHSCATLLLQRNVNLKVVQDRLGHSSISQTGDTYSHVQPDMQEDATISLEKLFDDVRKKKN